MDFLTMFKTFLPGWILILRLSTWKKRDFCIKSSLTFAQIKVIFPQRKSARLTWDMYLKILSADFPESYNEEAGAHFTSRDIIYLMCDLLVAGDESAFTEDGISKLVYDMTMGTSQMLTCMEERLKQLDADADITVFGQEFNPFTFGIAKADMLIRGGDPNNMQFGDTLSEDKFDGYKFDYVISNPPFAFRGNGRRRKSQRNLRKALPEDLHQDCQQR